MAVITNMWQLRCLTFIICVICMIKAVPTEAKPVNDKWPPPVRIKNRAERCIKDMLDAFWVRNAGCRISAKCAQLTVNRAEISG